MSNNDENDENDNFTVYGGPLNRLTPTKNKLKSKRIIKAGSLREIAKVMTIGGDCKDDNSKPPSIIIERDGDRIARIIVKCTCGRHAELVCEVEEQETHTIEEKTERENETE